MRPALSRRPLAATTHGGRAGVRACVGLPCMHMAQTLSHSPALTCAQGCVETVCLAWAWADYIRFQSAAELPVSCPKFQANM